MPEYSVRCVRIERVSKSNVKNRTLAPQSFLAIFGFFQSLVLLALAISYQDGMAILAVGLLSLLSTLVGVGNKWQLRLHKRDLQGPVPIGNVVIRYPKGNFLVVECTEEVARELYFAPEAIDYLITRPPVYRLISLIGTMMIMFGVIALANAQIQLQLAFASAYILLNAAYWIVAALPSKMSWDASCFKIAKQRFDRPMDPAKAMDPKTFTDYNPTFTWALWKAILATKRTNWVKWSNATPNSAAWDRWVQDAYDAAETAKCVMEEGVKVWKVPDWDPQAALSRLLEDPDYSEAASLRGTISEDAVAGSGNA